MRSLLAFLQKMGYNGEKQGRRVLRCKNER